MARFEHEKRLVKRKILFLLIIAMNEVLIWYMGDKDFFGYKISVIGNWIRVIIIVLIVLSVLYYIKEKAINIEVKS